MLFLVVCCSITALSQYNCFNLPYAKKNTHLSFSNYDNIVLIEARINDSIPVKLILDSGVEGVIITDMTIVSTLAGRCIRDFRISAPGTIEVLDACITSPVKVSVKGLTSALTNVVLLSQDYFSLESYVGTHVDGLIGLEKFRYLITTIDYSRNLISFVQPSSYKVPRGSQIIPLSIYRGKPYMNAQVAFDNGSIRDVWLMVDSGANHPLLLETDSLSGYIPEKSLEAVIGKGLAGNMNGRFARVEWLMLGYYRLDNVLTSFTDDYIPGNPQNRMQRNGTLGSGALSRFIVSFDYQGSRMILKKGALMGKPFEYNMSGIVFRSIGSYYNVFEVSDVIKGSPADLAGIKNGDVLLTIDGHYTFSMTLGELNRKLSEGEGMRLRMRFSRDGKPVNVKLKLRRLI